MNKKGINIKYISPSQVGFRRTFYKGAKVGKRIGIEMEVGLDTNADITIWKELVYKHKSILRDVHSDSSAGGVLCSPELVTIPLTKKGAYKALERLADFGKFHTSGNRAGVHFHIGHGFFDSHDHILKTGVLASLHPHILERIGNRPQGGWTAAVPHESVLRYSKEHRTFGNTDRKNVRMATPYGTFEFRMCATTGDKGQLKGYLDDIFKLIEYTRTHSFADVIKGKGLKWNG